MYQRFAGLYRHILDNTRAGIPAVWMLMAAGFFLFLLVGDVIGTLQ